MIRPNREKRAVSSVASAGLEGRWLLLLHQIPAKPDYLRVKIWRRMQRIGAVAVKNAAWALPASADAMEDFQRLIREIEADGGDALLCEARFLTGLSEDQAAALAQAFKHSDAAVRRSHVEATKQRSTRTAREDPPLGGIWVTRRDIYVDRIASAWLIAAT